MAEPKKKCYIVRCQVNMDASREETVLVKATKPHIACSKAVGELIKRGFFHARVNSYEEVQYKDGGKND